MGKYLSGGLGKKEFLNKEDFDEYIDIEFEGYKFKSIKNYDKYLKQLYGDYMKLPPKEKQISYHEMKVYYKE